jgi:hypothetical protein
MACTSPAACAAAVPNSLREPVSAHAKQPGMMALQLSWPPPVGGGDGDGAAPPPASWAATLPSASSSASAQAVISNSFMVLSKWISVSLGAGAAFFPGETNPSEKGSSGTPLESLWRLKKPRVTFCTEFKVV